MMTSSSAVVDRRGVLAGIAATASLSACATTSTVADYPSVRAMVDRYVAEGKAPNMVVAIGRRRGEPVYCSAGALALGAGAPAGPDTLFRIYSMSKPVTGCAIMILVEEGKLSLDAPLADIFPGFAEMGVLTDAANSLETRPATSPILIRHLVTHSSGLVYASNAPGPLAALYTEKGILPGPSSVPPGASRPPNLIALAEASASLPLFFEPGTRFHYSIGLDIAGAVVERVSGVPFEVFLEQRIFAPLGMADTSFTVPAVKLDRFAANYARTLTGIELIETAESSVFARPQTIPSGGGGLVSSAHDYSRFAAMLLNEGLLNGVRILKRDTARVMMSNLMEPNVMATTVTYGPTGHGVGGRSSLLATPGGEGIGAFGWNGAASTQATIDRANGVYAVLMTQVMRWQSNTLHRDLTQALYADLAAA